MSMLPSLPPLAITFISSIILLGSAADLCHRNNIDGDCTGREAYAVAVGTVSTALCLVMLPLLFLERLNEWLAVALGVFLSVWWCFGVGFNTSATGPFNVVSNGYFSSWFCLFGSFYFTVAALSCIRNVHVPGFGAVSVIFVASIVEFACAANVCVERDGPCTKQYGFAVAVGVISTVIALSMMIFQHVSATKATKVSMPVAVLLFTLWAFGAGFNTSYVGPFNVTSICSAQGYSVNGYFSTWVAFFASLYYMVHAIPAVDRAFSKVMHPTEDEPVPMGMVGGSSMMPNTPTLVHDEAVPNGEAEHFKFSKQFHSQDVA